MMIYFFTGLCFSGLGLAAYLQLHHGGDLPLRKQLPWLAAFGLTCGAASWIDMFLASGAPQSLAGSLAILRAAMQALSGLLLLKFGWGILDNLTPLPAWTIFIPGVLIVPIAYAITYASTTFITPSPIEIPVDIWSRYFLYLPGSILAGTGFLREWNIERKKGYTDVANLMMGAGLAFLFEAFVVGLVVPAAPYGPASYYNYNRVASNAFIADQSSPVMTSMLTAWLDYAEVLKTTGLPIEFWRMISAFAVTFFVVRGLDVFDATQNRQFRALQVERDQAQEAAFQAQIVARQTAESWTDALVSISRQIAALENVDDILQCIVQMARCLLGADFIGLAILNEEHSVLEIKCYADNQQTVMVSPPVAVVNPLILGVVSSSHEYLTRGDEAPEMLEHVTLTCDKAASSMAVVPLNLESHPFGALWMARCEPLPFSETDAIWLECMADQVVIAIQHGLMTAQLQSLSIVEERGRIARDMHDGLAQVLGYLNLQLQTLDALFKQGKLTSFQSELEQMRQAIQVANADVRENILSLRTTLSNEKSLVSALGEYFAEFGVQTGLDVAFINDVEGNINLSSVAEVQLVCILQEALTNVRKHAHASHIRVLISKQDEDIVMEISDDGIGFVMHAAKLSFGLQTMRERAQSAGGEFEVHSIPDQGTQIECRFPCLKPEKLSQHSLALS